MIESTDAAGSLDVLVLGELNPDVLVDAPGARVEFGQVETEMSAGAIVLGSSGAITAVAARRFGLRVAVAGVVGEDAAGALVRTLLDGSGVDTAAVLTRPGVPTGLTVVVNAPGGDRALLTYPGAMSALRVRDVPAELWRRVRHVHVSSLFLQQGLQPDLPALFARLRRAGVTTSLDTGWDPARDWTAALAVLPELDLLLPNAAELRELARAAGLTVDEAAPDWVEETAGRLSRLGPSVAVKLGGHGGLLCTPDAVHRVTTTPAVPVDTTGAGDNFNAGFLHAWLEGADPPTRLVRAVAAGTLSVRGRGGTGSVATPVELATLSAELADLTHTRALTITQESA